MKAIILLGTLKKEGLSNTETLVEFLSEFLNKENVDFEVIRLVEHNILPGTYSDMGQGGEWPSILDKIIDAEILIFATPIWWGSHSSEIQKVIERLDNLHDEILEGKPSKLDSKVGGIIISGDSDGGEQIIGIISNFLNAVGVVIPPYATLTVLSELQAKDHDTTKEELMELYKRDYTKLAEKMAKQLVVFLEKVNKQAPKR